MLLTLNLLQLVFYIGLLALLGQGLLYVLSGVKRESNLFYQLFVMVNRPWLALSRLISPSGLSDRLKGWVALAVVAAAYVATTLAKIEYCVAVAMQGCR